jgi:hypothetical protein
VCGFLLGAPYSLLDLPAFLERFAALAGQARTSPPGAPPAAILYFSGLRQPFEWPAASGGIAILALPVLLMAAIGFVMGGVRTVRGPGRLMWGTAVIFAAAHFAFALCLPGTLPRHLLTVMPTLCIVTAAAVISGVSLLRRYELSRNVRTAIIVLLTMAVLAPPAAASVAYARNLSRQSTRDLAFVWIQQHVTPSTYVVVESGSLSLPRRIVNGHAVRELRDHTLGIATSDTYGRYLAAPQTYRQEYLDYMRLFSQTREAARFSPGRDTPGPELRILTIVP